MLKVRENQTQWPFCQTHHWQFATSWGRPCLSLQDGKFRKLLYFSYPLCQDVLITTLYYRQVLQMHTYFGKSTWGNASINCLLYFIACVCWSEEVPGRRFLGIKLRSSGLTANPQHWAVSMAWASAFLMLSFVSLTGLWFPIEMIISSYFTKNPKVRTQSLTLIQSWVSTALNHTVLLPPPKKCIVSFVLHSFVLLLRIP